VTVGGHAGEPVQGTVSLQVLYEPSYSWFGGVWGGGIAGGARMAMPVAANGLRVVAETSVPLMEGQVRG
jgi:hypothetical protein